MHHVRIAPSLLAADFGRLAEEVAAVERASADLIHIDVMDGHFVPNLTLGPVVIEAIRKVTKMPLDVHLMVAKPEAEARKYFDLKPAIITFHYEATTAPIRLAEEIRARGIQAGISLNPRTPVSVLEDLTRYIDVVLLMSVEPGFYGQKFIDASWERLTVLKSLKTKGHPFEIEVDGGVSDVNASQLVEAGADILVSGSYVFKGDMKEKVKKLKGL